MSGVAVVRRLAPKGPVQSIDNNNARRLEQCSSVIVVPIDGCAPIDGVLRLIATVSVDGDKAKQTLVD